MLKIPRRFGWLGVLALLALPTFILRAVLLRFYATDIDFADLRGFFSDACIVGLVFLLCVALRRLGRALVGIGLLAFVLLTLANYEHFIALGSLVDLRNAHYVFTPTFFLGSVVSRYLLPCIIALLVVGCVSFIVPERVPASLAVGCAAASVVAGVTLALWPGGVEGSRWRQSHFLLANISTLSAATDTADAAYSSTPRNGDLNGTPRVAQGSPQTNVLVIALEGLSGALVPSIRGGVPPTPSAEMTRFDQWTADAFVAPNFLAQQRQTNRGVYALVCGDYPRLRGGSPEMTLLAERNLPLDCLPRALKRHGYRTVFMQASSLQFQMFDRFMPLAGFDEAYGDESMSSTLHRGGWGLDDKTFFHHAAQFIDELERDAKPWFLTLVTVGTHHPYDIPEGYDGPHREDPFGAALDVADQALVEFLSTLKERGRLKDTLVIITSDESNGVSHEGSDDQRFLEQAWGLFVALVPTGLTGNTQEMYAQMDLALSILDYLGLPEEARSFRGRSIFRDYDQKRAVAMGNVYLNMIGLVADDGTISLCQEDLTQCRDYRSNGERMFRVGPPLPRKEVPSQLPALVAAADGGWRAIGTAKPFQLAARDVVAFPRGSMNPMFLFGGQYLRIPPQQTVEASLELDVEGPSDGDVDLVVFATSNRGEVEHLRKAYRLSAGHSFQLLFSLGSGDGLEFFEVNMKGRVSRLGNADAEPFEIRFRRALLTVRPCASDNVEQTATVHNVRTFKRIVPAL